jgi:hypothetical protein
MTIVPGVCPVVLIELEFSSLKRLAAKLNVAATWTGGQP